MESSNPNSAVTDSHLSERMHRKHKDRGSLIQKDGLMKMSLGSCTYLLKLKPKHQDLSWLLLTCFLCDLIIIGHL